MKLGIITDIHSNLVALKSVLSEFEKENIDKIICCGDIIGIGPCPEETIKLLLKYKDRVIAVKGNHEQYLLSGLPQKVHENKRKMNSEEIKNHEWTKKQVSESSRRFLDELPIYLKIEIEGRRIFIIHYPIDKNGKYRKHIKNATIEENKEIFDGIQADIFIYGHTHAISVNKNENKWYINPGSLWCPLASDIANAGILTVNKDKIEYKQLYVKYDVEQVKNEINNREYPFYKEILKIFYGEDNNEN